MRSFWRALGWAWAGIGYAVQNQRNIKIHLVLAATTVLVCIGLKLPRLEMAVVFVAIFMVLGAEMFNSALEAVVDLFSPRRHPLAKAAKDMAAGAVVLTALNALVVAWLLILPRLINLVR